MNRLIKRLCAVCAAACVYVLSVMLSVRAAAQPAEAEPELPSASVQLTLEPSPEEPAISPSGGDESIPEPESEAETKGLSAQEEAWYLDSIPLSRELQRHTYELCRELEVEYPLVLGVMYVESRFQTDALREGESADMVGVMQINSRYLPSHYKNYGVDNAYEPEDNITIGVNMLAQSIRRNGVVYGLMEYNMGIVNMRRCREEGVASTGYTEQVLAKRDEYALALRNA